MTIPVKQIYPRTGDKETIYLKHVITNSNITVGDFTMYNDFVNDPTLFENNNVLYHYPINHDKLQNSVPLPVVQNSFLTVLIIRCLHYPLIHFLYFLRNGD